MPAPQLSADALAAWRAVAAGLEGLAADFAATATAATWRDDTLEVTLPAEAATAAAFLRRADAVAAVGAALLGLAGRPVRHAIVLASPAAAAQEATAPAAARRATAVTQATLVRAAADHPLVAHARTLFDVAIRKVEPPRTREAEPTVATGAEQKPPSAGGDEPSADDQGAEHDG